MVLRSHHHSTDYSERRTIWQGSCVSEAGSLTVVAVSSLAAYIRERILYKTALLTFKTLLAARIVSITPGRSATTSTTDKIAAVL